MPNVDRNFVLHALFWLVVAALLGLWAGASGNVLYVGVQESFTLSGFVTLFIYGAIYRLWPGLKRHKLVPLQFWLAVATVPFLALGTWLQIETGIDTVIALALMAAIVAAMLLFWIFWSATKPEA